MDASIVYLRDFGQVPQLMQRLMHPRCDCNIKVNI